MLRIQFDRPVSYRVAQSADIQSIVVAISGNKPSAACKPEFPAGVAEFRSPAVLGRDRAVGPAPAPAPARAPASASAPAPASDRPTDRPPGRISEADLRTAAATMDEARAALKKNNLNGAILLLAKALKYPENEYSAEAQELLGLARQRNGQIAAAKAEYEDYLRRYPSGEGNERVRQRLAGIVTAGGEPDEKLRTPANHFGTRPLGSQFQPKGETLWTFSGSVSEFYIRDDSFQVARDASVAPDPTDDADAHRVHQNEMLSSVDLLATWNNDQTKGKIRFSGTEEHHFDPDGFDRFGVAALFSEIEIKDWDVLYASRPSDSQYRRRARPLRRRARELAGFPLCQIQCGGGLAGAQPVRHAVQGR